MMYSITYKTVWWSQLDQSTAGWKPAMSVSGKDVGREGNDTCKQSAQYVIAKRKPRTKTSRCTTSCTHWHTYIMLLLQNCTIIQQIWIQPTICFFTRNLLPGLCFTHHKYSDPSNNALHGPIGLWSTWKQAIFTFYRVLWFCNKQ